MRPNISPPHTFICNKKNDFTQSIHADYITNRVCLWYLMSMLSSENVEKLTVQTWNCIANKSTTRVWFGNVKVLYFSQQ